MKVFIRSNPVPKALYISTNTGRFPLYPDPGLATGLPTGKYALVRSGPRGGGDVVHVSIGWDVRNSNEDWLSNLLANFTPPVRKAIKEELERAEVFLAQAQTDAAPLEAELSGWRVIPEATRILEEERLSRPSSPNSREVETYYL